MRFAVCSWRVSPAQSLFGGIGAIFKRRLRAVVGTQHDSESLRSARACISRSCCWPVMPSCCGAVAVGRNRALPLALAAGRTFVSRIQALIHSRTRSSRDPVSLYAARRGGTGALRKRTRLEPQGVDWRCGRVTAILIIRPKIRVVQQRHRTSVLTRPGTVDSMGRSSEASETGKRRESYVGSTSCGIARTSPRPNCHRFFRGSRRMRRPTSWTIGRSLSSSPTTRTRRFSTAGTPSSSRTAKQLLSSSFSIGLRSMGVIRCSTCLRLALALYHHYGFAGTFAEAHVLRRLPRRDFRSHMQKRPGRHDRRQGKNLPCPTERMRLLFSCT